MFLDLTFNVLLFFGLTLGLAWPLVARLQLDPMEKIVAVSVLSLLVIYVAGFVVYLLKLSDAWLWLLPILATAGLIGKRRALGGVLANAEVRMVLIGLFLIVGWSVLWLATIVFYAGGGWTSDWFEHWERAQFFFAHWPLDTKFLGFAALPARPPLANLITSSLLGLTGLTFPGYQLLTTLGNCLVFLPAGLLARRFNPQPIRGASPILAMLAVLFMLNPSFMENVTFAWTKLLAAFFTLCGLYFFLRARDPDAPPAAGPLCAASLAAGLLAHYSAGPYVLILAAAWLFSGRWHAPAFRRSTVAMGLIGGLILASWFGWSFAVYGGHTTLASNSSVSPTVTGEKNRILEIALNLRDTLVPHFLRSFDKSLIAQRSPWGFWSDWFFQLYQLNLFFVFGSVGWLVILRELSRAQSAVGMHRRWFWLLFGIGAILLGIAVNGGRDEWGLAHICLQPLVLLGLSFLAARWPDLGTGWKFVVGAGLVFDFCWGLALHFGVESLAFDLWFSQGGPGAETVAGYTTADRMNIFGKLQNKLQFVSDVLPMPLALVLALLAAILMVALFRVSRASRPSA